MVSKDLADVMATKIKAALEAKEVPGAMAANGPVLVIVEDTVCYIVEVHTVKRGMI